MIARVLFLHEELMKLPSFPRKALEADLGLYSNGCMGKVKLFPINYEKDRKNVDMITSPPV